MGQNNTCAETVVEDSAAWWRSEYGLVRYGCRVIVWLGIGGALIASGGGAAHPSVLLAQTSSAAPGHLSVRPHEMATVTQTDKAGEQPLKGAIAYVPNQCVGAHRCPLVIALHGGGDGAKDMIDMESPLADKYGMIVVALKRTYGAAVDTAMTDALRRFAIDPDKIALTGGSNGGASTLEIGRRNLDIFSRLAPLQAVGGDLDTLNGSPQNNTTQFLVSAAIGAGGELLHDALEVARSERRDGHMVKLILGLYPHSRPLAEYDYMFNWLRDSWAATSPATQDTQSAIAPSYPPLTTEAFTKMMTFWMSFMTQPDSIRTTARKANRKEILIPVEHEQMWVYGMVDVSTLATKYMSVATALRNAGLTAQQEEAYRSAFVSARATEITASSMPPASVLGKNVAFIRAHRTITNALMDLIGVPHGDNSVPVHDR